MANLGVAIVRQYQRGVVFRFGKLRNVRDPGFRFMIPLADRMWRVTLRTVTMPIPSQQVITRDNVSIGVAAVACFRRVDPVKSIVEIEDVSSAISQIAQTTVRNVVPSCSTRYSPTPRRSTPSGHAEETGGKRQFRRGLSRWAPPEHTPACGKVVRKGRLTVMARASWTTTGVFAGRGGVRTDEAGIVTGDLTVHTTWDGRQADVAVQYSGTSQWFTLTGSPVPCPTQQDSRHLHQAVVEAVVVGGGATVPQQDRLGGRP